MNALSTNTTKIAQVNRLARFMRGAQWRFGPVLILVLTTGSVAYATEIKPVHYIDLVEQSDRQLYAAEQIVKHRPGSWPHLEHLVNLHLARVKLTGEFQGLVSARAIVEKAFAVAEKNAGPFLARARLNFTTHRLPDVESDLIRAETALLVDPETREAIMGIRADVHLYSGRFVQAKLHYDRLEADFPSTTSAARLAHYYAQTARYHDAEQWIEKATRRVVGQSIHLRAWLHLQSGILDLEQGQWDQALVHYRSGLKVFPGFWLLEEHVAEIHALQGRSSIAEEKYRDLIHRTGSPLFMSALSDLLNSRSSAESQAEAAMWRGRASTVYESRLEIAPEVVTGHALDFYLQGEHRFRALQLAKANHQWRPGGQSAVQLVQALGCLGRWTEAFALLDMVLSSPFRSAELHATAKALYQHQGNSQQAYLHEKKAKAINPKILENMQWLQDKLMSAEF